MSGGRRRLPPHVFEDPRFAGEVIVTKLCQHRGDILNKVIQYIVDHPYEHLSVQRIADACGLTIWQLRYNFGNVDHLFRATANALIGRVVERTAGPASSSDQMLDVIHAYATFLAHLFESEPYRNLIFLLVRNGRHHRWLEQAYERRVVAKICAEFEALVVRVGERRGLPILLKDGAAKRLYGQLETEFVLRPMLPAGRARDPMDRNTVISSAARQAFEATYVFDWKVPTAA
ncbi:TetR/AcrR family transcriptional regulator [Sphingosinicella sp.]|uniref:TetR/AcrR family transcriptional regulator n=1 Tax=Sphingosinicella sp. TaxID=1917971 RepID=UPI004037C6F4